jgi:Pyruvate/2-oxoacid:ferredoxin oxidoreductase delta subunit
MDAVVGMEGNGPLSGTPAPVGLILASRNPHALDSVACRIIGIAANIVPTLSLAEERGLIDGEPVIVGDDPACLAVSPFHLPDTARPAGLLMKISRKILARFQRGSRFLLPYPEVISSACIGCGACVRICPVEAASHHERRAAINLSRCIRCYCCHESCEEAAITLRQGLLSRIILGNRQ